MLISTVGYPSKRPYMFIIHITLIYLSIFSLSSCVNLLWFLFSIGRAYQKRGESVEKACGSNPVLKGRVLR